MAVEGVALPPYYDDHYHCQMEVLQFDSRLPNSKYINWILELGSYLSTTPVICPERAPEPLTLGGLRHVEPGHSLGAKRQQRLERYLPSRCLPKVGKPGRKIVLVDEVLVS